jgi:type I restriction enzyme M protein
MGTLIDRVHRELTEDDIEKIVRTYHAWRGDAPNPKPIRKIEYQDVPGFCKSATANEIATHGHVLTPGRYVGAEEVEDEGEPFEEKMAELVKELEGQFEESRRLGKAIKANLKRLGYGS